LELKGSLLVGIREPRSREVLNESSHLDAKSPQFGVYAVWDHNGPFKPAACYESRFVVDLDELHRLVIDEEP
jgi:hypothetical protein